MQDSRNGDAIDDEFDKLISMTRMVLAEGQESHLFRGLAANIKAYFKILADEKRLASRPISPFGGERHGVAGGPRQEDDRTRKEHAISVPPGMSDFVRMACSVFESGGEPAEKLFLMARSLYAARNSSAEKNLQERRGKVTGRKKAGLKSILPELPDDLEN